MSSPPAERRWPPLTTPSLALAVVFVIWGLLQLFDTVRQVFFLTFFAAALASLFEYPIALLSRWVSRVLAAFLTFVLLVGLATGLGLLTIPTMTEQAQHLLQQVPEALVRLQAWWQERMHGALWEQVAGEDLQSSLEAQLESEAATLLEQALPVAFGTLSTLGGLLLVVVLALFFAHQPRAYLEGMVRLVPREREEVTAETLRRMGAALQKWMVGTLASMTVVGTLIGLGLYLLGVESWLVLAVIAFFGEFVPFFGPVLASIPGLAMGLADSPLTGFYVLLVYIVVQQLEGNLVQRFLARRALRVRPGVLLVWQVALIGGFGLLGLLVATPLLASLGAAVEYTYIQRTLGKTGEGG